MERERITVLSITKAHKGNCTAQLYQRGCPYNVWFPNVKRNFFNDLKNQIKDAPGNTMPRRILPARALPTTAAISPKQGCQTCAKAF